MTHPFYRTVLLAKSCVCWVICLHLQIKWPRVIGGDLLFLVLYRRRRLRQHFSTFRENPWS